MWDGYVDEVLFPTLLDSVLSPFLERHRPSKSITSPVFLLRALSPCGSYKKGAGGGAWERGKGPLECG